ncbi:MAG: bifunctional oligoribonuclease/PAP phosphatase NrnA [Phycisphaerae bacterium]
MKNEYDLQSVTAWLEECYRPLVISHQRPDGDSLGAIAGMCLALRRRGLEPTAVLFEPLPGQYAFLESAATWCVWEEAGDVLADDCDALVILDTCAQTQLEPLAAFLLRAPRTLVIDHHATRDPIGMRAGDLRVFDDTASATSLIVAEWIRSVGLPFDEPLATALFTGIATDCGWFRFTNTDARTMRMATALVEAGADASHIYNLLHQQDPPAKLCLIAHMLSKLELKADGKLAVMYLRSADFEAAGADSGMTENLVNEATRLGCTEAALLFIEEPDRTVRVNFRSKRQLDVSELARRFGGGGHARAAGARLRGAWDHVVPRVIAEMIAAL